MKTKNLILALIASIFTIGSLMANEPAMAPKEISSSVANLINENISYPVFAKDENFEGDVLLEIVIEEDGTFDVTAANSINTEVKNHVIEIVENLENDKFDRYAGQTVQLKISFDLRHNIMTY